MKCKIFNISILYLHLHLVFITVPTRQTVPVNDYYDLSDFEIISLLSDRKKVSILNVPRTFSERN